MKYDNIINHPHHVSTKHPQMPLLNRAAQFAPFAALTGHKDAIDETARITDMQTVLDTERVAQINRKLQYLKEHLKDNPVVNISYFEEDKRKGGGSYINYSGRIKRIDEFSRILILSEDDTTIKMENIHDIKSEIFSWE